MEKDEPKRRQVTRLSETTKEWHGVWQEITFSPRGEDVKDLGHMEMLMKPRAIALLKERLRKHGPLKLVASAEIAMNNASSTRLHGFSTGSKKRDTGKPLLREDDIADAVNDLFATLTNRVEEYEARGSGWTISSVNHFTLKCTPYKALSGRGWIDFPQWLRAKKCVVNIKNSDDRCFLYAMTLATHLDKITTHRDRPSQYEPYLEDFKLAGTSFPVSLDDLPVIEKANDVGINIFGVNKESAQGPADIHLEYKASLSRPVNLLRVFEGTKSHFCYISNLDGLMREKNEDNNICGTCLQNFSDPAIFDAHTAKGKCVETTDAALKELPTADKAFVRFTEIEKQLRVPFGMYLAMATEECDGGEIKATRVCVKAVSDYPDKFGCTFKEWEGSACIPDFLEWLAKRESFALSLLKHDVGMKLTPKEEASFQAATVCYICDNALSPPPNRHRDHNHITGIFRGAACPGCNINLHHKRFMLTVFCHGLKELEAHLLIKHMDKDDKRELRCLPQSVEKILSFTWGRCKFVDTRAFLDAPLPELVASLRAANPAALSSVDVQVLASPTKQQVLQLLCVFEAFRAQAQRDVGLDPAHFVGVPGLAWTAMLRKTKARIGCFREGQEDMLDFVQSAIRGGVCAIRKRLARANNPLVDGYDATQPTSWLQYLDCNSLYPSAMLEKLPVGDFEWVELDGFEDEANFVTSDLFPWSPASDEGFFVQADVSCPTTLHEAHNDFPLLPEQRAFGPSPFMQRMAETLSLNRTSLPKLIPNLCDKERIACHVRELQQAMQQGLQVTKIHRALKFRQSAFLKPWIELCVAQRRAAQSAFEGEFWKLMMNAVFGKTCEQVQNRLDVKFVKAGNVERLQRLTCRPQFKDAHAITPDLLAVELGKCRVTFNKPIAVGAAILGIAKASLADFWYGCIKAKYPQAQLCMTDTDSLLFHVETPNLYGDMAGDTRYDTSNYPRDHPLYCADRAKIPGFFKDETGGRVIREFVGLRSKMYSLEMADGGPTKKAAGGILLIAADKLTHQQYREALHASTVHKVSFSINKSTQHTLTVEEVERVGLCPYDDKVWVADDGITTFAHGHKSI